MSSLLTEKVTPELIQKLKLNHIAIIMDGNRRWAKENNLPTFMGHKEGVSALKRSVIAFKELGIKYLTVYAFSTENWNRDKKEVEFLMELLGNTLKDETKELNQNGVKISIIGDKQGLSKKLQKEIKNSESTTKDNTELNLQLAINYGSRAEITNTVKKIQADNIKAEDITEETISNYLYTRNMPDPELVIRTGGEYRLSNYLLWQLAYAEIFISKIGWPAFNKDVLEDIILEFAKRNRRFGA